MTADATNVTAVPSAHPARPLAERSKPETDSVTDSEAAALWRNLRALVVDGLDAYRRQIVALTGLPYSRITALRRLRSGPLTPAALADAMLVDRPAATVAVDDLCTRGLVQRRANPGDRRSKLISLTADGEQTLGAVDRFAPPPPAGWETIPATERAALARVLNHIAHPSPHAPH